MKRGYIYNTKYNNFLATTKEFKRKRNKPIIQNIQATLHALTTQFSVIQCF